MENFQKYGKHGMLTQGDFISFNIVQMRQHLLFFSEFFVSLFVWKKHSKFMEVKWSMVTCTYNVSTWEAETGGQQ